MKMVFSQDSIVIPTTHLQVEPSQFELSVAFCAAHLIAGFLHLFIFFTETPLSLKYILKGCSQV